MINGLKSVMIMIQKRNSLIFYATVGEKQATNLKIHYDGWSRKWDTWSDFNLEIHRFAVAASIGKRPSHRFHQLKKGDYVNINPSQAL